MKKLIICALCAIFGWTAATAQKYAVVDMEYILKNIPAYERANAGVTNLYNRNNLFYFDRMTLQRVDQLPILATLGVKFIF